MLGDDGNRLFNLGDPAARQFLTDFLDERIKQWRVDIYRNDFNFDPLPYWQHLDTADRQGIAEMKYLEGLYTLWDELHDATPVCKSTIAPAAAAGSIWRCAADPGPCGEVIGTTSV